MGTVVRPAVGRFDEIYELVGVKKPVGPGCRCMSYRDPGSRVRPRRIMCRELA